MIRQVETPAQTENTAKETEEARLEWAIRICVAVTIAGSTVLAIGLCTVWQTGWGIKLFVPAAAMMASGVAGFVTINSIVRWSEQRQRENEQTNYQHREEAYEQLANIMVIRFLKTGYDVQQDADLRARAALWAKPTVIHELARWQQRIRTATEGAPKDANGRVALSEAEQIRLKWCLGSALIAMRSDLGPEGKDTELEISEVLESVFNEPYTAPPQDWILQQQEKHEE